MRVLLASAMLLAAATAGTAFQAPAAQVPSQIQVQNGRIEPRPGTDIAAEAARLAPPAGADPVWLGWRVPIVAGGRGGCSWYVDDGTGPMGIRASVLESSGARLPQIAPPTGPVPIEAGTGLMVLLRLLDGQVERIRTLGDDCPIDAGGRTLYLARRRHPRREPRLPGHPDPRRRAGRHDAERVAPPGRSGRLGDWPARGRGCGRTARPAPVDCE